MIGATCRGYVGEHLLHFTVARCAAWRALFSIIYILSPLTCVLAFQVLHNVMALAKVAESLSNMGMMPKTPRTTAAVSRAKEVVERKCRETKRRCLLRALGAKLSFGCRCQVTSARNQHGCEAMGARAAAACQVSAFITLYMRKVGIPPPLILHVACVIQ